MRLHNLRNLGCICPAPCSYLIEWSSPETLKQPHLYYYRGTERREIDLPIVQDGTIYPIEIRKSATPKPGRAANFEAASRLGLKVGEGGVVCLRRQSLALRRGVTVIPLGLL